MLNVFYSVLPIFLIALIGSLIRRRWIRSDEFWRGLEKLSFYLLFPAVLFEHISSADMLGNDIFRLVVALVISTIFISILLIVYYKKSEYNAQQFTSIFQGGTRYNNYIFFGLAAGLFGDEGLRIVSFISPYMIIFTNVISVMIFVYYAPTTHSSSLISNLYIMLRSVVTNPFVIASIVGFSFNHMNLKLNTGIERTIQNLADSALAIGVLIVGASLKFRVKPENFKLILFTSSIKLILMPLITFIILWIMNINGLAKSVGIVFSCLPCASSAYILSRQLGGDPETMSSIITFTTLFSIISLSMLVYILG